MEKVAAAYSQQVPWDDASPMEKFFLNKRFPDKPEVRYKKEADEVLGLESVFFSNVSSAVRRGILLEYPFDEELIMSEDQQLSRDLITAGYKVCYVSESVVTHSHRYSLVLAFRRYFDSVYSLTKIFDSHGVGTADIGCYYAPGGNWCILAVQQVFIRINLVTAAPFRWGGHKLNRNL